MSEQRKTPPKIEAGVRPEAGGHLVTVNGRPAKTPRGNALIVPARALADAIAAEINVLPATLMGKGLADPAAAPNFRISAGAIDVVCEADGRAEVEKELLGYAATDLVCIRADRPDELVAREDAVWGPLCSWFNERFGVGLVCARGLFAAPQPPAVAAALAAALAALDPFRLAVLSLATRSAGSIVVGFALCEGRIDADAAFAAATLEETFQEEKWGADHDAAKARQVKQLDLAQAARFLELLSEA
jgi:chaperone required for assembly of F1-ATPase